ncbi:MAG: type III pantothenate kinase [Pirellulales bacterium]
MSLCSLIAVDVGNSRTKLGWFDAPPTATGLPTPKSTLELTGTASDGDALRDWLRAIPGPRQWLIASVSRPELKRLREWQSQMDPETEVRSITFRDLDLIIDVAEPKRVGIDRLLGAVAANRLRMPGRAAVVIDVGTAITIDLVSERGAFLGGAILPGIALSARALHKHTDQLPLIPMTELSEAVPPLGKSTVEAMSSGLFWGAVGAMRELVERLGRGLPLRPEICLTGGAAESVAKFLGSAARHVPHLVLGGIVLGAEHSARSHDG